MRKAILCVLIIVLLWFVSPFVLGKLGSFLVVEDAPLESADAVVVLSTGVDYLPRLIQAADLFRQGTVQQVVVNGNRKTDIHRQIEARGFVSPQAWYENTVAVLVFLGVDKNRIVTLSAEDVYDTVTEADFVGLALHKQGLKSLIITTSKFHTRRAIAIWRHLHNRQFRLQIAAAHLDPFLATGWWHSGRQIRQVLSEYGAWLYFWGTRLV